MAIDQKAIEEHIRGIIAALGDDPTREGLKDTPARTARMYCEMFEGMNHTNDEIAEMFGKTFDEEWICHDSLQDMVVVRDIDIFSHCEHHLALMYDMKVTVAYLPQGKVIGLSKIARIADMVSRRLQLQERIGADIAQAQLYECPRNQKIGREDAYLHPQGPIPQRSHAGRENRTVQRIAAADRNMR